MTALNILQISGSIILAAIPALIWVYIFFKRQPEDKHASFMVFSLGAISVFPILLYKYLWQYFPWINAFQYTQKFDDTIINLHALFSLPLGVIFTFMVVGIIEELMKHYCVRSVNFRFLRSIDDVIEFSIIAALGFAFTENILYFYNIWEVKGVDELLKPFLFRSVFSTFAHVMFSGIFGYYYGMGLFAKLSLQKQIVEGRSWLAKSFFRIFHFRTSAVFYEEKLLKGLFLASFLHAIFNVLLHLQLTFLTVPYLVGGYIVLSYLLDKKENHKQRSLLRKNSKTGPVYKASFKLLS